MISVKFPAWIKTTHSYQVPPRMSGWQLRFILDLCFTVHSLLMTISLQQPPLVTAEFFLCHWTIYFSTINLLVNCWPTDYKSASLYTVPLESKLPVSSRFLQDESRVSRDEILVSRESLKRKFWNITEVLVRRKINRVSRALVLWCANSPCQQWIIPSTCMFTL